MEQFRRRSVTTRSPSQTPATPLSPATLELQERTSSPLITLGTAPENSNASPTHRAASPLRNILIHVAENAVQSDIDVASRLFQLETHSLKIISSVQEHHLVGERECYNLRDSSLFILSGDSRFRRGLFSVIDSKSFERFVLLVIVINSMTMILQAPEFQSEWIDSILVYTEVVFLAIFTAEMVLKVAALGFIMHKNSYLRSSWNVMDFIVVVVGYVGLVPGISVAGISVVRLFRIMRPLRAVSRVPGLTVLITAIMNAVPGMIDVFLLLLFLLTMFSVFGVQLWAGVHSQRCYLNNNNTTLLLFDGEDSSSVEPCGGTRECPTNTTCAVNPDLFVAHPFSFDNFGTAILLCFKVVSLDNWPDDMSQMQSAQGHATWIFFFLLTIFGSYYTVNLILAVLSGDYQNAMQEIRRKEKLLQVAGKQVVVVSHEFGSNRFRAFLRKMLDTSVVKKILLTATVVNLVVLALDHYAIPTSVSDKLDAINLSCTVVFFVEMVIKLTALFPRVYFHDKYNLFDFVLVVMSLAEWAQSDGGSSSGSTFTALRAFRLARVIRMMQANPDLKHLVHTIKLSLGKAFYLLVLIAMLVFIFSILGLHLFGGVDSLGTSDPAGRSDFQTLWQSMITVFIIITGENWATIMARFMAETNPFAAVYFVIVFTIGNLGLLNLFVAILIDSFQSSYSGENEEEGDDSDDKSKEGDIFQDDDQVSNIPKRDSAREVEVPLHFAAAHVDLTFLQRLRKVLPDLNHEHIRDMTPAELGVHGTSLGIFSEVNPIRLCFARILKNPWAEPFVMFMILANGVTLAIDDPSVTEGSTLRQVLTICDYIFTSLFTLEMVMKMIVSGLLRDKMGYFRDPWNRIDFFVVVLSLLSFQISFLRNFRSFRTVRLLARVESSRRVIVSLFHAIPAIRNVVLVVFFIFLVFGILGVQLYKGRFASCTDLAMKTRASCLAPAKWVTLRFNFDDVIEALITLFVVALGETWSNVLYNAIDASDEDVAQSHNARPLNAIFILIFVFVGSFFATNLFVGMLIEKFHEETECADGVVDESGAALLTKAQQDWMSAMRVIRRARIEPRPMKSRLLFRKICYRIALDSEDPTKANPMFELFITACIITNVLFMTIEHYNQSSTVTDMLFVTNLTFTIVFTSEMVLKLFAMLPGVYFRDPWNRFDCVLVIVSLLSLISNLGANANALRVMRILRLIKKARGLQMLFSTLVYSAPALGNIALVLILVYFLFGVLGVDLFGEIDYTAGYGMTRNLNFHNLPYAMATLYTISTTEQWTNVYIGCSATTANSDCVGKQCGVWEAGLYFFAFMVVTNLVGLNLLVYVVVDNYFQVKHDMDPSFASQFQIFDDIRNKWTAFDYDGEGSMRWETFCILMRRMPGPIGLYDAHDVSDFALLCKLRNLEIPVRLGGLVCYNDSVAAISRYLFNIDIAEVRSMESIVGQADELFAEYDPNSFMIAHAFAVRKIGHLMKRRAKNKKVLAERDRLIQESLHSQMTPGQGGLVVSGSEEMVFPEVEGQQLSATTAVLPGYVNEMDPP